MPSAVFSNVQATSPEAPAVDSGAEKVEETEKKRAPRAVKPATAADEPVAAVPSEAAPSPTIAQPAAQSTEKIIKTV